MQVTKTTEDIEVRVRPTYCHADSSPRENLFIWNYEITIHNHSCKTVQLLNRFWKIIDACGQVQEVHGPGVVGERPIIAPGDEYKYVSMTHLPTSQGQMVGHYEMISDHSRPFRVDIPLFRLQHPVRLVKAPELEA